MVSSQGCALVSVILGALQRFRLVSVLAPSPHVFVIPLFHVVLPIALRLFVVHVLSQHTNETLHDDFAGCLTIVNENDRCELCVLPVGGKPGHNGSTKFTGVRRPEYRGA